MSKSTVLKDMFGDDSDDDEIRINQANVFSSNINKNLGEIRKISNIGGGRGVFSTCDLTPGILIVAEIPSINWSQGASLDDPEALINIIIQVIVDIDSYEVSKTLHPIHLKDADKDEINRAIEILTEDITKDIKTAIQNSRNDSNFVITKDDILRVYLVLQHNGFGSGLYASLTMFNHSCDPNCIKYNPSVSSSGASEIWTTRDIKEGEELSICYCDPIEMPTSYMRNYLESHHRFICNCNRCQLNNSNNINDSGKITNDMNILNSLTANNSNLSNKSINTKSLSDSNDSVNSDDDDDIIDNKLEINEDLLLKQLEAMEKELIWSPVEAPDDIINTSAKMLKSINQLISFFSSNDKSNGEVLINCRMKARTYKVAITCSSNLLQSIPLLNSNDKKIPKKKLIIKACVNYLRNSLLLLKEQELYLGKYHPDMARTFLDIKEGLSCMSENYWDELKLEFPSNIYPFSSSKTILKENISLNLANANKIKNLYSIHKRFPKARINLKKSGSCYWSTDIPL